MVTDRTSHSLQICQILFNTTDRRCSNNFIVIKQSIQYQVVYPEFSANSSCSPWISESLLHCSFSNWPEWPGSPWDVFSQVINSAFAEDGWCSSRDYRVWECGLLKLIRAWNADPRSSRVQLLFSWTTRFSQPLELVGKAVHSQALRCLHGNEPFAFY